IAIILIEHDMSLVMNICDGICVLNFGQVIAKGTPDEIQSNPAVIEAYLGTQKESSSDGVALEDAMIDAVDREIKGVRE
ncbi:MAG: hypothetical protein IJS39_16850, partial [Synergistaceae bacterium]|nr:hypothetical protein [Synergistaceae bacterium]